MLLGWDLRVRARRAWPFVRSVILSPAARLAIVYVYLCLPHAVLAIASTPRELDLTRGFLDRRLAYLGVLVAVYQLLGCWWPRAARALFLTWLHASFLIEALEAGLIYSIGLGFSPLVFFHFTWPSLALGWRAFWPLALIVGLTMLIMGELLRRSLRPLPWSNLTRAQRVVWLLLLLFGVRSADVLWRHGIPAEFGAGSLVINWRKYEENRRRFDRMHVTAAEREVMHGLGLVETAAEYSDRGRVPAKLNLITIYLEGFQADFSAAWGSPVKGLTPRLDRFAERFIRFDNFYNAVTPTINALISSQCGILSEVENEYLSVDRGYTRNLVCLSDYLHRAGYYQVFLGGANTGFSGKGEFLEAHQFDEVWGWEQWEGRQHGPRNSWGLQDTDLVREAVGRLPDLAARGLFHLSLLTVNTHPPGFVAPDCPPLPDVSAMLAAIHCSDHAVGELLDELERRGYLRNTVVMLMGDHMMFPSAENTAALGTLAGSWFGKVFMALSVPDTPARIIHSAGFTPDFVAIALDALGMRPIPRFLVGRSPLSSPDTRRMLIAQHFEILDNRMVGLDPDLADGCSEIDLDSTDIEHGDPILSDCARDKILALLDQEALDIVRRR